MRRRCERAVDCRAQGDAGYYCPCRVREILAMYPQFIEQQQVMLGGGGTNERVQNKRPAHQIIEDQLCIRADIASTLRWLCVTYPHVGLAVATIYGLALQGYHLSLVGKRDTDGRFVPPGVAEVAATLTDFALARDARLREAAKNAAIAPVRRDQTRDLIGQGVEAMAYHLGWRPGYEEAS